MLASADVSARGTGGRTFGVQVCGVSVDAQSLIVDPKSVSVAASSLTIDASSLTADGLNLTVEALSVMVDTGDPHRCRLKHQPCRFKRHR